MTDASDVVQKPRSLVFRTCSNRFSLLLVSIVLTFALRPFLVGFLRISILTDIFVSLVLVSAIRSVSGKRRTFLIALALAVPCLVLRWTTYRVNAPVLSELSDLLGALFAAYVLISIFSFIARQQEVTTDVITAAVCGYFLLGFMWGIVYLFLESVLPGSFQIAQNGVADQSHFIYFSFVTMTTVGYGDTVPVSSAARSLSVLEAFMGQLYLAVTIARLVGIHISQTHGRRGE